jgi:ribosomal protein S18 acetylase RimI-like enzyme
MVFEIIGYIASAFVAVSLLMVAIVRLRILNLVGCIIFIFYGYFIGSIPIILANSFIALVNIYFLFRIFSKDISRFTYLLINENRKPILDAFIEGAREDIDHHFPLFNERVLEEALKGRGGCFLALRDFTEVGFSYYIELTDLTIFSDPEEKTILNYIQEKLYPDNSIYLQADYITRSYRGMGIAQKLYNELQKSLDPTIKFILTATDRKHKTHIRFLRNNGFRKQKDFPRYSLYMKRIGTY